MKNIKVSKKMLSLALFNMILLTTKPNVAYAKDNNLVEQTKDIIDFVKAKEDIPIKSDPTNVGDIVGTLKKGDTLKLLTQLDGYYEVLYNNNIAYVRDNVIDVVENDSTYGYVSKKTVLYTDTNYEEELDNIEKFQLVNIIKVLNDSYLVEVNGKAGYILKDDIERLYGMYIVVDISDQNVKMYNNNEVILDSPVVTGTPPYNSTPVGIYKMYYINDHQYLKGRYYVDHMMAFNGNIGCHDAEYHTNENGKKFGWRDISEFGGDTYLTDGSHGCVNMPHDASDLMREYVEIGQKVLVKE